jgi:uncharacterized protein with HEPN domain
MPRDPRAYLWDAREAAVHAMEFVRGKSFEEFQRELLLRSAVERQLEVLGEALNQLAKVAPDLAQQVPDLRRIVAFRNILIHGYAVVNHELVWRAIHENLPGLVAALNRLLDDAGRGSR